MTMRFNQLIVAGLVLAVCGLCTLGCKKAKGPETTLNPNSPDAVLLALQEQGKLLNDAIERKDFKYIHDFGYYFGAVLQAFISKLDAGEKQRLQAPLTELNTLSEQQDRAAGGRHAEASEAIVKRIQVVLKDLEQQYHQGKPPR